MLCLVLHGKEAPVAKPDCVRATVKLLNLDSGPFERIFEFRAGDCFASIRKRSERNCLDRYMLQIEQVVEAVDELTPSSFDKLQFVV